MTDTTQSLNVSYEPTESFDAPADDVTTQTQTSKCQILNYVERVPAVDPTPERNVEVGELIARWEADPEKGGAIASARRQLAETLFVEEPTSVRTLRLRMGLSQQQLADQIGTSQSHIARIERGANCLHLDTFRRLASALRVDLNTLGAALIDRRDAQIANAQ